MWSAHCVRRVGTYPFVAHCSLPAVHLQTKDANAPPEATEDRKAVEFAGAVDSVYLDTPGYVELDVGTGVDPMRIQVNEI